MGHLIDHIEGSAAAVLIALSEQHDLLVQDAQAVARLMDSTPAESWGTATKRVLGRSSGQPLAELVNQLATVERLIDVLHWLVGLHGGEVHVRANPTTSSTGSDLTVALDPAWHFEVSDVARMGDGNNKLAKDLASLRTVRELWPGARTFLAVSPEWSDWLARRPALVWVKHGFAPISPADAHVEVGPAHTGVFEVRPQSLTPPNGLVP